MAVAVCVCVCVGLRVGVFVPEGVCVCECVCQESAKDAGHRGHCDVRRHSQHKYIVESIIEGCASTGAVVCGAVAVTKLFLKAHTGNCVQ